MNCSNCGASLAENINICPKCGTPVTGYPPSAAPYDPTVPASYNRQQFPSTSYGSGPNQYAPTQPASYNNANSPYVAPTQLPYNNNMPPYNNMQPFQYPPNTPRKGPGTALIVGLVVLLILVIGGGLALLGLHKQSSDNQVTKKATTVPTATATPDPNKNPYAPGTGTLVVNDPMQDNSKGYEWNESTTPLTGGGSQTCQFNTAAYHTIRTLKGSLVCPADAATLNLSNIAYEAKLTVIKGDYSGLSFRINRVQETGYVFAIGVAGDYVIDTFDFKASTNNEFAVLHKGTSAAIKRGWNQTNLVAVVANGAHISLYVNGQLVSQIQDNTYTQGEVGTYGYGQVSSDIETKDVRIWSL